MIKRSIKIVLLVFLLVSLFIYWLFFTTNGLQSTLFLVKKMLPGELLIESHDGYLNRSLQLNGITYHNAEWSIRIEGLQLNWHPEKLLLEELSINSLVINGITINELTTTSHSDTKERFALPFDLYLKNAELNNVIWNAANHQTYRAAHLQLTSTFINQYPSPLIKFDGQWKTIHLTLGKNIIIENPMGSLQLKGSLDDYKLISEFNLTSESHPPFNGLLQANGDLTGLNNFWLTGKTLEGETNLQGNLVWQPFLKWDVTWNAKSIHPNKKWPNFPDNVTFSIKSAGEINDKDTSGYFTLLQLSGQLQKQPLIVKGGLRWENSNLFLQPILLTLADNNLELRGEVTQQWNMDWEIHLPNLTQFSADAKGTVSTSGIIKGLRTSPLVSGKIAINDLQFKQILTKELNGDFSIDPTLNQYPNINLTGKAIQMGNAVLDTLQIKTQPEGNKQSITANLASANNSLTLKLLGQMNDKKWQGHLNTLNIQHNQAGAWQLSKQTQLLFSREKISLEPTCLAQSTQQVCFDGQWTHNQQWQTNINGNNLKLTDIVYALNPNLSTNALLKFKGSAAKKADGKIKASLNAQLNAADLIYTENKETKTIGFKGGELSMTVDEKGLQSLLKISPVNSQPLMAKFFLPKFNNTSSSLMQQPLNAELTYATNDLQLLSILTPQLKTLSGSLNLSFTATGNLEKPLIKGKGTFTNGKFSVPQTGAQFSDITLNMATESNTLNYSGKAQSGKGALQLSGKTLFDNSGPFTQIKISGENVLVFNTQDGQIEASPQLTITQKGNRIDLTGSIDIPRALIQTDDFTTTVNLSPDIVFVSKDQPQSIPLQFYSQVKLTLGQDVKIDSMGLKTELAGSLDLQDHPNTATVAIGQLETVNGQYEAYGHNLTITQGKLIYTGGPIDNPGIAIKATKQRQTFINNPNPSEESPSNYNTGAVVVGVQINGTLNEPHMTLFSEPAGMSQSEILSYLVLGKPLTKSKGNDSQLLLSALSALPLGGTQSGGVEQQIKQGLGLDEINVTSTETYNPEQKTMEQNTALVLGKALSPKLFLSYTVGLVQALNVFNITYKLSDHWQIQTEAGVNAAGIDLFYTYERD